MVRIIASLSSSQLQLLPSCPMENLRKSESQTDNDAIANALAERRGAHSCWTLNQAGSLVSATVLGVLSREALGCPAGRGLYKYVAKRSLSTLRGFKLALERSKKKLCMLCSLFDQAVPPSWPCRGEKRKTAVFWRSSRCLKLDEANCTSIAGVAPQSMLIRAERPAKLGPQTSR